MGISKYFSSKQEKEILKKAEEIARAERKKQQEEQKIADEKRKTKDYNRKKVDYDARNWEYAIGQDGFGRFAYFLVKYSLSVSQRVPFNVKENIKLFKIEALADMITELLPSGEKPPKKE